MSNTNLWQIHSTGLSPTPFASLGLVSPKITKHSQGTDTAAFKADGKAFDSAFFVPWGTICTITKAGEPWFTGRLTKPTPQGSGNAESIDYELNGPWWDLANCTYQQQGNFYNGNGASPASVLGLTPLIVLGYECPGDSGIFGRLTTGQQIQAILAYAIFCGANLQIGAIDFGINFPVSKQKGMTCDRLIMEVLQWVPDQTFSFDYTTTPPTANVVRRVNAKVVTYAIPGPPADSIKLTPRNDLQVPCVGLFYVFGSNAGGSNWSTQSSDIYPPGANVAQLRALVAALELSGGSVITQKQPVSVAAIPQPDDDNNIGSDIIEWFARHVPSLQDLTLSKLTGVNNSWYAILDTNGADDGGYDIPQKDANGNPLTDFDASGIVNLPNELISGTIPPWLCAPKGTGQTTPTDGYVHAAKITIKVRLQYTGDDSDPNYDYSTWINNDPAGQWFYVDVMCTDATTQVYQKPVSETNAEIAPAGMAEYLYNALALLHFEGQFTIKEQECNGLIQVGNALNITGGRAEWATMLAQVNSITEDLDTGETQVSVGPPRHLGASELLALIRSWRNITSMSQNSGGLDSRSTGTNDAGTSGDDGIGMGPGYDNHAPPVAIPGYGFQMIDASAGGNAGRLQVLAASLGGVWPTGMGPGDATPFYLTMANSPTNYIIAKLAINSDGTFGAATVYTQTTLPTADGSFVYLVIGLVKYDGTTITILTQSAQGSQFCIPSFSPDGTIVSGNFGSLGS